MEETKLIQEWSQKQETEESYSDLLLKIELKFQEWKEEEQGIMKKWRQHQDAILHEFNELIQDFYTTEDETNNPKEDDDKELIKKDGEQLQESEDEHHVNANDGDSKEIGGEGDEDCETEQEGKSWYDLQDSANDSVISNSKTCGGNGIMVSSIFTFCNAFRKPSTIQVNFEQNIKKDKESDPKLSQFLAPVEYPEKDDDGKDEHYEICVPEGDRMGNGARYSHRGVRNRNYSKQHNNQRQEQYGDSKGKGFDSCSGVQRTSCTHIHPKQNGDWVFDRFGLDPELKRWNFVGLVQPVESLFWYLTQTKVDVIVFHGCSAKDGGKCKQNIVLSHYKILQRTHHRKLDYFPGIT